ncbi:glycosyltransferase [Paenibacillus taichungensis]
MQMKCDIILPVYNSLSLVRECIVSLLAFTSPEKFCLYIIDDSSDIATQSYLEAVAENYDFIKLIRNEPNLGFLRSCNLGMRLGQSPYVLLLNSDVIVTPNWLDKMITCMESDPLIASVNPFCNRASNIDIPLAPGANFFGMNERLQLATGSSYPDVVTGVGFCMMLRREALDRVGLFDEIYGQGYCEESDLCMRLTTNGYRTVVASDVYVYHKGSASFVDRKERYIKNREIFDSRWKKEYLKQYRKFVKSRVLEPYRTLSEAESKWDPLPVMRQTYRVMRSEFRKKRYVGFAKAAIKGSLQVIRNKRPIVNQHFIEKVERKGKLRVTYILPQLSIAGGVLSVIQLVNELILLGVEARIIALREYPEIYDWKMYTKPIIYRNKEELVELMPETDIVVATHWSTAEWALEVLEASKAKKGVYFLQDYEGWFHENEPQVQKLIQATYEQIPNRIVKSDWLKEQLKKDGFESRKIRLGMDLSVFYPRTVDKKKHPVIMSMARPRTPWRGFTYSIAALEIVKSRFPDVEIILFGEDLSRYHIPFDYIEVGHISDQNKLAELYSISDIYLDGSDFQGFGRPALEAMACGTACVLTNVGGVTEYAVNNFNCLLVPPKSPDSYSKALIRLIEHEDMRNRLVENGKDTVKEYDHKREALETLNYFNKIDF